MMYGMRKKWEGVFRGEVRRWDTVCRLKSFFSLWFSQAPFAEQDDIEERKGKLWGKRRVDDIPCARSPESKTICTVGQRVWLVISIPRQKSSE